MNIFHFLNKILILKKASLKKTQANWKGKKGLEVKYLGYKSDKFL